MALAYEVDEKTIGHFVYDRYTGLEGSGTLQQNITSGPANPIIRYNSDRYPGTYADYVTRLAYDNTGYAGIVFARFSNGYILQKSTLSVADGTFSPRMNRPTQGAALTTPSSITVDGAQYTCMWASSASLNTGTDNAAVYTRALQDKAYNDSGGKFGWFRRIETGYPQSVIYRAQQNNYNDDTNTTTLIPLHVFLIPSKATSTVTVINGRNTGVITNLGVIKVKASVADTLHIILDGAELGTMDVQANVDTVVPLGSYSGQISKNAKHTLQLRSNYNGYLTEDKTTFTYMETGIEVTGTPQAVERRPTACSLVTITDIPAGATAVWQVTNNANDDNPSWEIYEGDSHVFENTEAASGTFALSWKVNVDAGTATTQPKITEKVGMGVLYDEGD